MLSQTLVREYALRTILPSLYGIPGLARILVVGGGQREYHVDLDPAALAAAGLSAARRRRRDRRGQRRDRGRRRARLLAAQAPCWWTPACTTRRNSRASSCRNRTAAYRVGSLGSVHLGVAPLTAQMAYDAKHAVAINFYALPGADNVRMARAIKARLRGARAADAPDIAAHRYWDATDLIVASQASLRDAIFVGALLALGRHLLFPA